MRLIPVPTIILLRRLAISVQRYGVRGSMLRSWRRLLRSMRNHGLSGTFERAFRKAPVSSLFEEPRPAHPFDVLHGTDTSSFVAPRGVSALSVSSLHLDYYSGMPPSALTQAVSALPVQPERFTFVDLGCGKGRALMVAARFPFPRLLGVELSPPLCEIARANVALKEEWASRISILNGDATTVEFPNTPLVIFIYDPFYPPVLRRVLANLEQQLRKSPRETWVLYAEDPRYTKVMKRFPYLRVVSENRYPVPAEEADNDFLSCPEASFTLYSAEIQSQGNSRPL